MYAVISSGGKQHKVAEGETVNVELAGDEGAKLSFAPVLVVDGKKVVSGAEATKAKVEAKIVANGRGKKLRAFNYKPKSNIRKKWGHRQAYSTIEITKITV